LGGSLPRGLAPNHAEFAATNTILKSPAPMGHNINWQGLKPNLAATDPQFVRWREPIVESSHTPTSENVTVGYNLVLLPKYQK
jgi:hypothetical protein